MALKLEPGAKLVVATHNPGKARELAAILDNRFELVTAGSLGLPEPEETEAGPKARIAALRPRNMAETRRSHRRRPRPARARRDQIGSSRGGTSGSP